MSSLGATEDARRGQKLVIGPWVHGGSPVSVSGEYNFGTRAGALALDLQGQILSHYDYWLKGEDNGFVDQPPVRIFVMGENVWRYENSWPLDRAANTRYYLRSGGRANTLNGDGALSLDSPNSEPPDVFAYNPLDPAPTRGGQLCCDPAFMAAGGVRPAPGGGAPRRACVLHAAVGARHGGHGACDCDAVRLELGQGHRLYRKAGWTFHPTATRAT